ncbi:MAG: MBL fold metallo-hydrolase [Candidatus Ratteibacteria bacterium]
MKIKFIGTSTYIPDIGQEVSSFIINDKVLVDTGWCSVLKMREFGCDPLNLKYLIITHLHQDHYIGLPQLLFYFAIKKVTGYSIISPLTIIGPSKYIRKVIDKSIEFLQIERFPELSLDLNIIPLAPGDTYKEREFILNTFPAKHMSGRGIIEEAFVCNFTETNTQKLISFTGDTSFEPKIANFFKNTLLLIHDVSHSLPEEAAEIAKMANAKRLYLIHYSALTKEEILLKARRVFPNSFLAKEGKLLEI